MRTCYIIAEAGSCHDGSLSRAVTLIQIAADAGANAVKFQYWSDSHALALARHDENLASFYEPYRMLKGWLDHLSAEAKHLGLDFLCTCYLTQDIPTIAPYVDRFKIASPDALNEPFITAHRRYEKEIIVSVGMLTELELYDVPTEYTRLHCVSAYPCPLEQVNLGAIRQYELDGFSDHTGDPCMGAWAYLAGANVIEAHIRADDTKKSNPDYPHALSPTLFNAYVANVRQAQEAWGSGDKVTQPAEAATRKYMA
jgi:sialic acid synthase SpsE